MKKKEFLEMVMAEINTIKERATLEEIGKLDFKTLEVNMPRLCIYGQMTGYCNSKRAHEISLKMFENVANDDYFRPITFSDWKKYNNDEAAFTPLEVYITMKGAKNKQVIQYLKGEINTLVL